MSRVATGWIPSRTSCSRSVLDDLSEDGAELLESQLRDLAPSAQMRAGPEPITLQMSVDIEADGWEQQWQGGQEFPECEWPSAEDMGPIPPMLQL